MPRIALNPWCVTVSLLLAVPITIRAQESTARLCPSADCDPARLQRRTLRAGRIAGAAPVIDGRLDDAAWATAATAADFVEARPNPGGRPSLRSEVRVLVDDRAIYVAVMCFDSTPERIQAPLARRDDYTTSDWAFVEMDTRHDRRSGFSFGLNPRGVQVDGAWLDDTTWHTSWDAVWEGAAHIDRNGWSAEFRIPFSQLAFSVRSDTDELVWGVNFYRYNPARGESSNWSPRFAALGGVVSNFNELRVPSPRRVTRLEVSPYIAPRVSSPGATDGRVGVRAGVDTKIGLGSSFNLTATVLPDFGQVEADPSQVNLSAFEVFQTERRPFFVEGLDLFRFDTALPFSSRGVSFADEVPFYSRRIGSAPPVVQADEGLTSIPSVTTVLGAVKVSGQTSRGWLLGLFSAATGREVALMTGTGGQPEQRPLAAPATTTVGRAIRTFHNGDSSAGFFVANLHRYDLGSRLATEQLQDQTVAGADVRHRFARRQYEIRGWMLGSRLAGTPAAVRHVAESPQHYFQRPDTPRLHGERLGSNLAGLASEIRISRVGGNLRWDAIGRAVSPGFDVNDVGFQRHSDWLLLAGRWQYDRFRPGRWIRAWRVGSDNVGLGWTTTGEPRAKTANAFATIDWRSYWSLTVKAAHAWPTFSLDRLRGGPALLLPSCDDVSLTLQTDQRRPSYVTFEATAHHEPGSGSWAALVAPTLNIRNSDRLQWSLGPSYNVDVVGWQTVGRVDRTTTAGSETAHIVGRVAQTTASLTARADITFSPRFVLQLYTQAFATSGRYDRFQRVVAPRDREASERVAFVNVASVQTLGASVIDVDLDHDGRVDATLASPDGEQRSLNGTLVLRWEYRPGSFLTFAWNHQRDVTADARQTVLAGLGALFRDPSTSVVLLKASYRLGS